MIGIIIVGVSRGDQLLMLPVEGHEAWLVGELYLEDPGIELFGDDVSGAYESRDAGPSMTIRWSYKSVR